MTRADVDMLKEALIPHDADYDMPCISPHNLEIVLEQLLLESQQAEWERHRNDKWANNDFGYTWSEFE